MKLLEEEMGDDLYARGVQHFSYIGHKSANRKINGIWDLIKRYNLGISKNSVKKMKK